MTLWIVLALNLLVILWHRRYVRQEYKRIEDSVVKKISVEREVLMRAYIANWEANRWIEQNGRPEPIVACLAKLRDTMYWQHQTVQRLLTYTKPEREP